MTKEMISKDNLTPKQIVAELDRYIVGQDDAKKAVAIALRNRIRRKMVPEYLRDEIVPKNILMIGSTGVGKTEIARRLAKLVDAPFIKIEATKFTEVGYVGRDVESIIRDLVDISINIFKTKAKKELHEISKIRAIERILECLVGSTATADTKENFRSKVISGKMDETEIEIKVQSSTPLSTSFDIPGMPGASMGVLNIGDMLKSVVGSDKMVSKKLKIKDALKILIAEEADKMIDQDKINRDALTAVENDGIVFLDEIDKIASREDRKGGEVSREGVQRDLLPLIEGTSVTTKYGTVQTDHILFIASGAFHLAKPSDLLPELQGRLPIRVELKPLSRQDMLRILTEPETSLIKQYVALLATEDVTLIFEHDAIDRIAGIATDINREVENIGARRLHTLIEKLLEDISFNASERQGEKIIIDTAFVEERLGQITKNADLTRFIL